MSPWKHAARLLSKARAHAIECCDMARQDYEIVARAVDRATDSGARTCDDVANAVDAMASENVALRAEVSDISVALVTMTRAYAALAAPRSEARCPEMRYDHGQERCALFVHDGDDPATAAKGRLETTRKSKASRVARPCAASV
jgi:hypothetical protein